jgi:uncharacterized protein (TIGR02284 family)
VRAEYLQSTCQRLVWACFLLEPGGRIFSQPEDSMRTTQTVRTLNQLILTCRDAETLCGAWAASASSPDVRCRLRHRSEEWGRQGDELQALVLLLGGEPETTATAITRLKAAQVAVRASLLSRSDNPALEGCDLTQRRALTCYEHALAGYLPERIRRTLSLQTRQIAARCEGVVGPILPLPV